MKGYRAPLSKRIEKHVIRASNGCLEWTGALNEAGYARLSVEGRNVRVHRLNWELTHGAIPDGMFVCHRCDNPKCVDPDHLFLGTNQDNVTDMMTKGRGSVGERQGNAKLSLADVRNIRGLPTSMTHKEVADIYQISFQHVSRIRHGVNWNHVSLFPQPSNI